MRIVSLLGSATEIVFALGLGDRLAGISHECDYPPEALHLPRLSRPRFNPEGLTGGEIDQAVRDTMAEHGSVYVVDADLLQELKPDLVLTQAVCEVCAVPTASAAEAIGRLGSEAAVLSLDAHDLKGIFHTIRQVADAAGEAVRGAELVEDLHRRLEQVKRGVAGRTRPRTLMLEWLDPPFAPGHWVPEMVEIAGGENLLGEVAARSRQVAREDVAGHDPDVLLVEPCGYDLAAARREADAFGPWLREIAPRAVEDDRAWLLHSAWFSRSGPRVVEGIETLARLLHPEAFPGAASEDRAERWTQRRS